MKVWMGGGIWQAEVKRQIVLAAMDVLNMAVHSFQKKAAHQARTRKEVSTLCSCNACTLESASQSVDPSPGEFG